MKKIIFSIFMLIVLISCSDTQNNTITDVENQDFYDNVKLVFEYTEQSMQVVPSVPDNSPIPVDLGSRLLIGRQSWDKFKATGDFDPAYNYDFEHIAFDRSFFDLRKKIENNVAISYYVIDSDSSLVKLKRILKNRYRLNNGVSDYIPQFNNIFENENFKIQDRQIMTLALLDVKIYKYENRSLQYSSEYSSVISNPDTSIANAAIRRYGDSFASEFILGGAAYQLSTYQVKDDSPYKLSAVKMALLEHLKNYFNLNTLVDDSYEVQKVLSTVSPWSPGAAASTGSAGFFIMYPITPAAIKDYIEGLANPDNQCITGFKYSVYKPIAGR